MKTNDPTDILTDIISYMKSENYEWNDIVECFAKGIVSLCEKNIDNLDTIEKIILETVDDQLFTRVYVRDIEKDELTDLPQSEQEAS